MDLVPASDCCRHTCIHMAHIPIVRYPSIISPHSSCCFSVPQFFSRSAQLAYPLLDSSFWALVEPLRPVSPVPSASFFPFDLPCSFPFLLLVPFSAVSAMLSILGLSFAYVDGGFGGGGFALCGGGGLFCSTLPVDCVSDVVSSIFSSSHLKSPRFPKVFHFALLIIDLHYSFERGHSHVFNRIRSFSVSSGSFSLSIISISISVIPPSTSAPGGESRSPPVCDFPISSVLLRTGRRRG